MSTRRYVDRYPNGRINAAAVGNGRTHTLFGLFNARIRQSDYLKTRKAVRYVGFNIGYKGIHAEYSGTFELCYQLHTLPFLSSDKNFYKKSISSTSLKPRPTISLASLIIIKL